MQGNSSLNSLLVLEMCEHKSLCVCLKHCEQSHLMVYCALPRNERSANLLVVDRFFQYFRCLVPRRTLHGSCAVIVKLTGDAVVGQLCHETGCPLYRPHQNVLRLQVPKHDTMAVQVCKRRRDLQKRIMTKEGT